MIVTGTTDIVCTRTLQNCHFGSGIANIINPVSQYPLPAVMKLFMFTFTSIIYVCIFPKHLLKQKKNALDIAVFTCGEAIRAMALEEDLGAFLFIENRALHF